MKPARIFVSVAEDSADAHAAALMRCAARENRPWTFAGLTGPRMRALGAETVFDMASHAAMLSGVFGLIGRAWKALAAIRANWQQQRPDAVLLLDSPELNLRIAKMAREAGLPVIYYIAPQTWASRAGRNRRIARDVDRLACILPFEQEYFRDCGVPAEYVGHPLFESLSEEAAAPDQVEALRSSQTPLVALLPGSRKHVIRSVLPIQLDVVRRMRAAGAAFRTAISAVDEDRAIVVREILSAEKSEAEIVIAGNAALLTAADLVLVASGTATLHVAAYRKPMIVMYDAGLLGRLHSTFGRFVLTTPHLSLVNILGRRRIVPEFMPRVFDRQMVARLGTRLLHDDDWRTRMISDLDQMIRPLEQSHASRRVCQIIEELTA